VKKCSGVPSSNPAVVHHQDPVGRLAREPHFVGDDDHRRLEVESQSLHDIENLAYELRIQGRGRLVEEHQLRLHRERAGDRDALLLATRELRRVVVDLVGQPDLLEQGSSLRDGVSLPQLPDADRCLDHILERGHVPEEVEALEDHSDLGALAADLGVPQLVELVARLPVADQPPVDPQPPGVDSLQMVDAT